MKRGALGGPEGDEPMRGRVKVDPNALQEFIQELLRNSITQVQQQHLTYEQAEQNAHQLVNMWIEENDEDAKLAVISALLTLDRNIIHKKIFISTIFTII